MDRSDLRRADILTSYWDDVALDRAPADPQTIDGDVAALIERLQALGDLPSQDSARDRVWRDLQQHPRWKEPDVNSTAFSLNSAVGPPLANPLGWPRTTSPSLPGWRARPLWPLAQAAIVLLLLASFVVAYFSFFRPGGEEPTRLAPGVATPAAEASPAAGWPMYRGNPARTGVMPGPGPQGQPVELWRFQAEGPALHSPAVVGDVVYGGSGDGFLYALDRASGSEIWRYEADGPVEITPTIVGDAVYVVSLNGTLAALDRASGEERWRFANPIAPHSTPVVVDGALFAGGEDGNLYALNSASGAERWRYAASGGLTRSVAVADGLAYVGSEAGQLHAVDAASGEERWVFVPESTEASRIGTPTVFNGMVIANHAGTMYALDALTGEERWRSDLGAGARPATAGGDTLYTGAPDGLVRAIDAATGEVRWTFATNDQILGSPALVGDTLYVSSFDRTVYALDAATGAEQWGFTIDGDSDYGPAVADGVVYVSTRLGTVYAIGGSETGQLTAPTADEATPVPAMEGAAFEFVGEITGGDDPLDHPAGMAVAADGTLYVVEARKQRIRVFDRAGAPIAAWGEPGADSGQFQFEGGVGGGGFGDVKIGPDGSVYVVERIGRRVQKFTPDGEFVAAWGGFGTDDGNFISPNTLTIDADGRVHVIDSDAPRIQVFDADGEFLRAWGSGGDEPGQFDNPWELLARPDGTFLVSDTGGRILAFDGNGAYTGDFVEGGGNLHPDSAFGLDIDAAGNVYAYDFLANTIFVFAPGGSLLTSWGEEGSGPGQFRGPNDIALGADGLLYVADYENNRIQMFRLSELAAPTAHLEFVWRTTGGSESLAYATALAVDPDGNLWVSDSGHNRFQIFAPDGTYLETWGEAGGGDGQFNVLRPSGEGEGINGLAFAPDGGFYVADAHNNRIQHFDRDRNFVRAWGSFGRDDGQFVEPIDVILDAAGNVYVVDDERDDIQKFDSEGNFLLKFGGHGSDDGELNYTGGGAIGPDGNLWIADASNNRLQQFAPDGTFLQSIGSAGEGDGEFNYPLEVAIDTDGNLYVTDDGNRRLQAFAADGRFLAAWTGDGGGETRLGGAVGIALDGQGNIYVGDYDADRPYESSRIQKFRVPPLGPEAIATPEA